MAYYDKNLDREIKRRFKTALSIVQTIDENGAGEIADQELRSFLREYNSRLWNHGPDSFPSSLQVLISFLKFNRKYNLFELLNEKDHLFAFSDFFDFITSDDCPDINEQILSEIKENTIYNYSCFDDPHEITISTQDNLIFGIASLSFVRNGNDISVFLVGGKLIKKSDENIKWSNEEFLKNTKAISGRDYIKPEKDMNYEKVILKNYPDMQKIIGLMRFDPINKTTDVNYLQEDWGNSFKVTTDDPSILLQIKDSKTRQETLEHIDKNQALFEICKAAVFFPYYFRFKIKMVKENNIKTLFGENLKKKTGIEAQNISKILPLQTRVLYRKVSSLEVVNKTDISNTINYSPPFYRVNVDGFWRRLPLGSMGKDPNGRPVEGRTWVKEHHRWRDKPEKPIEVLVKKRVSDARKIAKSSDDGSNTT